MRNRLTLSSSWKNSRRSESPTEELQRKNQKTNLTKRRWKNKKRTKLRPSQRIIRLLKTSRRQPNKRRLRPQCKRTSPR